MTNKESQDLTETMQRYVEDLMKGMAVVFDDKASDGSDTEDGDTINTIIRDMTEAFKTGFKIFKHPDPDSAAAFLNSASFVILDWNFDDDQLSNENEDPDTYLYIGEAKKAEQSKENIQFVGDVLEKYYVPILIASNEESSSIENLIENQKDDDDKEYLKARSICNKALESRRLYVCGKSELNGIDSIKTFLAEWLKNSPTVRIYLYLNELIQNAKSDFFVNLEETVPDWPIYIYDTIAGDEKNKNENADAEFQEFIVSLFNSRLEPHSYEKFFMTNEQSGSSNHEAEDNEAEEKARNIDRIYRQIKTQNYRDDNGDLKPSCGDVYQLQKSYKELKVNKGDIPKYILNITAPCDLAKPINPRNLFIPGFVKKPDKAKNYDKKSLEEKLDEVLNYQNKIYTEYQITRFVDDDAVCFQFSDYFRAEFQKTNENGALQYDTLTYVKEATPNKKAENKKTGTQEDVQGGENEPAKYTYIRKCRLVHPYITTIQERFAYYIVRHGLPSEPGFSKKP